MIKNSVIKKIICLLVVVSVAWTALAIDDELLDTTNDAFAIDDELLDTTSDALTIDDEFPVAMVNGFLVYERIFLVP